MELYTVILRRWISEESRNSYSALFHSEDILDAATFAIHYTGSERYDILLVVRTENVTQPEDKATYAFVSDGVEMVNVDYHVSDHIGFYTNILQNWEDPTIGLRERIGICYDYMEEMEFLTMVAEIARPIVEAAKAASAKAAAPLMFDVPYKKLLDYINGKTNKQELEVSRVIAFDNYKNPSSPTRMASLVMYHSISFALWHPNISGFVIGIQSAGRSFFATELDEYNQQINEYILSRFPLGKLLVGIANAKHSVD